MNSLRLFAVLLLLAFLTACGTFQDETAVDITPQSLTGPEEVAPAIDLPAPLMGMVDETPDAWFVEFASPPKIKGGNADALNAERVKFKDAVAAQGLDVKQRYDFRSLFNGLSVSVDKADVIKLKDMDGVAAVYPVIDVPAPVVDAGSSPDMATAVAMTGADIAQNELGLRGAGIKVGIIDTGIDLDHPDFGNRIQYGYDFVGDAYNAQISGSVPVPDPIADDCQGHGTHVAGITGADGQVVGVAPAVTLGAYRVFGCEGSTSSDIIIAALERALEDGMDVVNMSLGAAYQWPQYPSAQASNHLVDAGVVVVASAGNSGRSGIYSLGAPGVGEKVIGVASFDNTYFESNIFEVGGRELGYNPMTGSVTPPTSGSEEIVYIGRSCNEDALEADPIGKVALIVRGSCTFAEKALKAQAAGATAAVIHNSSSSSFGGTLGGVVVDIPTVSISGADGLFIRSLAAPSVTWLDGTAILPNPSGNLISGFSSYGLSPDLTLKPDLGAPGGLIYSTYPLEKGGYATLSGTSMSAPHVAGAVALLLEARPDLAAGEVRSVLQNNAEPQRWSLNSALGFLESVHRQGGGMIDIPASVTASTRVEPAKLSLGELQPGQAFSTTLTLFNAAPEDVTYTLSNDSARSIATGRNTYQPGFYLSMAMVSFSSSAITVPANGSASVDVSIKNPFWPTSFIFGGYVEVLTADGEIAFRVPYSGFGGDYQQLQVLTPTSYNFPWLAKIEGGSYVNQPDGAAFTMKKGDTAQILAHFEHQSRLVRMEVISLDKKDKGRDPYVMSLDYFGRNSTPEGFFAFEWDGTVYSKDKAHRIPVPMGDYQVKLVVQKALGGPDDVETWLSPVISISRSN